MILGFAHLAINTDKLDELEQFYSSKGYVKTSIFNEVKNAPAKKSFCINYQDKHDLILMENNVKNFSLELTCHGKITGKNNQLIFNENNIIARVREPDEFINFFSDGLGFKNLSDNNLTFKSINPSWCCEINVERGDTENSRVDAYGPSCLAFYSSNIIDDRKRLIKQGAIDCSDIFNLSLGVKSMDIFMTRSPGGVLVELIQIKKN